MSLKTNTQTLTFSKCLESTNLSALDVLQGLPLLSTSAGIGVELASNNFLDLESIWTIHEGSKHESFVPRQAIDLLTTWPLTDFPGCRIWNSLSPFGEIEGVYLEAKRSSDLNRLLNILEDRLYYSKTQLSGLLKVGVKHTYQRTRIRYEIQLSKIANILEWNTDLELPTLSVPAIATYEIMPNGKHECISLGFSPLDHVPVIELIKECVSKEAKSFIDEFLADARDAVFRELALLNDRHLSPAHIKFSVSNPSMAKFYFGVKFSR